MISLVVSISKVILSQKKFVLISAITPYSQRDNCLTQVHPENEAFNKKSKF